LNLLFSNLFFLNFPSPQPSPRFAGRGGEQDYPLPASRGEGGEQDYPLPASRGEGEKKTILSPQRLNPYNKKSKTKARLGTRF
jgi:hypothetical protein